MVHTTTPPPLQAAQLTSLIKAHIAKGDKAKEKADQHYIAAGQHLKTLKARHAGTWTEWEALLKEKIGIGKSRASEVKRRKREPRPPTTPGLPLTMRGGARHRRRPEDAIQRAVFQHLRA